MGVALRRFGNRGLETVRDYRGSLIEFLALRVITRGLFLAVAVMLGFLVCLARLTQILPGRNEIGVPTTALPDSTDIGAIVSTLVEQSEGALLGIVGAITLIVSAIMTANALRRGTAITLNGSPRQRIPYVSAFNLVLGLLIALLILLTWLLTLGTALRHATYLALLDQDVSRLATNLVKVGCTLLQFLILTGTCYAMMRSKLPFGPRRRILAASLTFGAITVLANFFLLYSNIAALIDPKTSSGIVMVLTLITWVNIVVRTLFLVQVWVVLDDPPVRQVSPHPTFSGPTP